MPPLLHCEHCSRSCWWLSRGNRDFPYWQAGSLPRCPGVGCGGGALMFGRRADVRFGRRPGLSDAGRVGHAYARDYWMGSVQARAAKGAAANPPYAATGVARRRSGRQRGRRRQERRRQTRQAFFRGRTKGCSWDFPAVTIRLTANNEHVYTFPAGTT
jgi:hypothetical protein